jgi:RHS repeat-associated protein
MVHGTGGIHALISSYAPSGKIREISHGNNTHTHYFYDERSTRLTGILTRDSGNNIIQNRQYEYTPAGDIESIYDGLAHVTYTYAYDDLHRLRTETNNGGYGYMNVNYDSIGNIISKTVGANAFIINYNGYNQPHAIDYVTFNGNNYDYINDANGNMTQGWDFTNPVAVKKRAITWNGDNMPSSINYGDGAAVTEFLYDGIGTRVRKKTVSGGSTTYTYYFGDHYEIRGGTEYKYIFAGNLRVAQIAGGTVSYFHKDHLGSSTVMTDASGVPIEFTNYEPFGGVREHAGTTASNYKFTDQELDAENGLYNYGARLYDPIIGRFISPDTIVPDPFNPQSLNRYSYCLNNPLIYVDPSGLTTSTITFPWGEKVVYTDYTMTYDVRYSYYNKINGYNYETWCIVRWYYWCGLYGSWVPCGSYEYEL